MNISPATFDAIVSRRFRRRLLEIPVRRVDGAMVRCPMVPGRTYTLRSFASADERRDVAELEPSRARAVLRFIGLADEPERTVDVTVREVIRSGDVWLVRFMRGDWSGVLDQPRLLAARPGLPGGDYTTNTARAVRGEPEAVSAGALAQFVEDARMREDQRLAAKQAEVLRGIDELAGLVEGRERKRLRAAANQVRAIRG